MADIIEAQAGIRNRPISQRLRRILEQAADAAGIETVRITSGGQPRRGRRTGSTRHDLGEAADLQLVSGGRVLSFTNKDAPAQVRRFVEAAVSAGATGVGAATNYMGPSTLHIGGGAPAAWGAGGRAANAPGWLKAAFNTGRGAPTPPNPIPGVADPSAPIPRANPLFAGDAPLPGTMANMWGRPDFAVAQPGGYFTQIAGQRVGPPGLTGTVEAGEDATATLEGGRPAAVTPTPVPRDRPDPLEKTIARVVTKKGLLKKGAKGEEVAEVQRVLNAMGITDDRGRPLDVDGNLGTRTRQAIANYQDQFSHLRTDGILGTRTLAQMMNDVARTVAPTMEAGMVLDPGMAGSEMSPVAQIAANMGADIARGFQSAGPTGFEGSPELPGFAQTYEGVNVDAYRGVRMRDRLLESFASPSYVNPVTGQPSRERAFAVRDAAALEVSNAFTPHLGTGKLGASRGLSFDTLNREGESIYSATNAFARTRVEDAERTGRLPSRLDFAAVNPRRDKEFEHQFGGSGDAFLRDSSGRRVFTREEAGTRSGMGNPSRAAAKGTGFTSRGSTGGFTGRAAQQATGRGAGQGTGSGAGRSSQQATPGSRSTVNRSGTVRRTGSFGHTRSGRPIGGV